MENKNIAKKSKRKRLIFYVPFALVIIYLLSQLVIYSFFENSKIVKINVKPDQKRTSFIKAEKGNYLVVVYGNENLGCNESSYVRYHDNKIEILSIEPKLKCWATRFNPGVNYTLCFNNIISATKAYLLGKDMLTYTRCTFNDNTNPCIFDGNTLTDHEQIKNYGFVGFGNYDKIELKDFRK